MNKQANLGELSPFKGNVPVRVALMSPFPCRHVPVYVPRHVPVCVKRPRLCDFGLDSPTETGGRDVRKGLFTGDSTPRLAVDKLVH